MTEGLWTLSSGLHHHIAPTAEDARSSAAGVQHSRLEEMQPTIPSSDHRADGSTSVYPDVGMDNAANDESTKGTGDVHHHTMHPPAHPRLSSFTSLNKSIMQGHHLSMYTSPIRTDDSASSLSSQAGPGRFREYSNKDGGLYDASTNAAYACDASANDGRLPSSSQKTYNNVESAFESPTSSPMTTMSSIDSSPTGAGSNAMVLSSIRSLVPESSTFQNGPGSIKSEYDHRLPSSSSRFISNPMSKNNFSDVSNVSSPIFTPSSDLSMLVTKQLPVRDEWLNGNLHNVSLQDHTLRDYATTASSNQSGGDNLVSRLPLYSSLSSRSGRDPPIRSQFTSEIILRSTNGDRALDIHYPRSPSAEVLMYALSDPNAPGPRRNSPATAHYLEYYGYGIQNQSSQGTHNGRPSPPPKGTRLPGALPYTPPSLESYTHATDPTMLPKRQDDKLRFPGDLYTPRWIRGERVKREGWCSLCESGNWLHLKTSQYLYHVRSSHGVNSNTGRIYDPPLQLRIFDDTFGSTYGFCGECSEWVPICTPRRKRSFTAWFKHAHQCHRMQHRAFIPYTSALSYGNGLHMGQVKPELGYGMTMLPPPSTSTMSPSSDYGQLPVHEQQHQAQQQSSSVAQGCVTPCDTTMAASTETACMASSTLNRSVLSFPQRYSLLNASTASSSSTGGGGSGVGGPWVAQANHVAPLCTLGQQNGVQAGSLTSDVSGSTSLYASNPIVNYNYSHRRSISDSYLKST